MNKHAFTFFILLSPLFLCGQNTLNTLVGDTIAFIGLDGSRDCFYDISSLEKYNFSEKKRFESEDENTSYFSVENCWLRVDSIIAHKKDTLVVFNRTKDGQKFVMKLPPIKKVPKTSFLQNHIKHYKTWNTDYWGLEKQTINYYYSLSCLKKSYYDSLVFELSREPLIPVTEGVYKAFDRYEFIAYKEGIEPIKAKFVVNGKDEANLTAYEIYQLLNKRDRLEERISVMNNSLNNYDIALINKLDSLLSSQSYWFNSQMFTDPRHELKLGPETVHYKSFRYIKSDNKTMYKDCEYKYFETVDSQSHTSGGCCEWPIGTRKYLGDILPNGTLDYLKGKLVGIKVLPTIISPDRLFDYPEWTYSEEYKRRETRKILDLWGDYNYYMIIVPDSSMTYKVGPSCDQVFGRNLIDTIFVPYSANRMKLLFTDEQMDSLETAHNESVQLAWAKNDEKAKKRYKTAVRLFGKEVADIVCSGEVQLGFTSEMCSFAYEGEPYHESYETIPIGTFLCRNYYMSGVKLYFKKNRLVLIQWIED